MNIKPVIAIYLMGLLLSGCGTVALPTDIPPIPTGLPPILQTIVATSPASGDVTSTPDQNIPVTGDGTNGTPMFLYALLALFGVIVLFGLYIMLGRPDRPPRRPDDPSED